MIHKRKYRYLVRDVREPVAYIDGAYIDREPTYFDGSYTPTYPSEPIPTKPSAFDGSYTPTGNEINQPDASIDMSTGEVTDHSGGGTPKDMEPDIGSDVKTSSIFPNIKPMYLIIGFAVIVGAGYLYKAVKKP